MVMRPWRRGSPELPGIHGVARVGRRARDLAAALQPGEIAIIDTVDIDRASASALALGGAAAVVNASPSISGRYPALGAAVLVDAGIPLLDAVGPDVLVRVHTGDRVRLLGDALYRGDENPVAEGVALTPATVRSAMDEARAGLSTQLEALTADASEWVRQEQALLLDGDGVPSVRTWLEGREVVVVLPGPTAAQELKRLKHYLRDHGPVLIGVDEGADVLLAAKRTPDLVVCDLDTVSEAALLCGAEIVAHAHRDGHLPGFTRAHTHGVDPVVFPATATPSDLALLLAYVHEAKLIVAVGSSSGLVEMLDRGHSAAASTFMTRLRLGGRLVDAPAVSALHRPRLSGGSVFLLLLAGFVALAVALSATPVGRDMYASLGDAWDSAFEDIRSLF